MKLKCPMGWLISQCYTVLKCPVTKHYVAQLLVLLHCLNVMHINTSSTKKVCITIIHYCQLLGCVFSFMYLFIFTFQLQKNGLRKNGILKNGLICDKFSPWKNSTFKPTLENEDTETSSSDTSDDDDV